MGLEQHKPGNPRPGPDQCNFPRCQLKCDVGYDNSSFRGFLVTDMLICKQIGRSSRYDGPTTLQVSIQSTFTLITHHHAVSYMDSQMGRILTELEDLELASNTVVSSIIINIKISIKTTTPPSSLFPPGCLPWRSWVPAWRARGIREVEQL